jgi:hypothetical protein
MLVAPDVPSRKPDVMTTKSPVVIVMERAKESVHG